MFTPIKNPSKEMINAWHDDPKNWKLGVFYYNPLDPRLLPPKRTKWGGWTANFANPYSILALIGVIVIVGSIIYTLASHI